MFDIRKARSLANVRRFNFEQCIRYQNVAEHSYFVALIAMELARICKFQGMNPKAQVLECALFHDMEEAVTGDFPFLVKRHMKEAVKAVEEKARREIGYQPKSYDVWVYPLIKLADSLELKHYLEGERKMGNTTLMDIESETWGVVLRDPILMEYDDARDWVLNNFDPVRAKEVTEDLKH